MIDFEARPSRDWLLVSEMFGPTFQGEGPSTGQLAMFIRLGGCNQHCGFCDTPHTWVFTDRQVEQHDLSLVPFSPKEELTRYTIRDVAAEIIASGVDLIVITGGEPLLQAEQVAKLISAVNEESAHHFEIETAGTVSPAPLVMFENVRFNVSPKLASSGNELELRRNIPVLSELRDFPGTAFKFVMGYEYGADLAEVLELQKLVGFNNDRVWLMPEGITEKGILDGMKRLSSVALFNYWHLSTRMHVLLWGNERGR